MGRVGTVRSGAMADRVTRNGGQDPVRAALGRLTEVPQRGSEPVTARAAAEGVERGAVGPLGDDEIAAGIIGIDEEVLPDAAGQLPDLLRRPLPRVHECLLTALSGAHAKERANRVRAHTAFWAAPRRSSVAPT